MKEIWVKTTVNNDYEVSNLGNIRSLKNNKIHLLKPFKRGTSNKYGDGRGCYLAVRLLNNGKEQDYAVHRLVAMAFVPNPNNLPQVNHINGIRNDNRAENLEWCDNSYNIWHSYNMLGNKNGTKRIVCQYTKNGNFVREYESVCEASHICNIDSTSIIAVCRKGAYRKTAGGYIWRYKGDENVEIQYDKKSPVIQISKYGEMIRVYDTIQDASIEIGLTEGGISGVCQKKNRGYNYAGGYIWRYKDEYNENEFGYYLDKTFIQMTMNNIFVTEYKGTHELVDKGGFELVKVIMCCKGDRESTNGFKWCIKEEGNKARNTKREKAVVQLDLNMNYIAEFISAKKAAEHCSTHATHIGDSCRTFGKRTCAKFRWLYKDDYMEYIKNNI